MSQHNRLFLYGSRDSMYCPVQAKLAIESPGFDDSSPDGPHVLGAILTDPMDPFKALNAVQSCYPWLSVREDVDAALSSSEICSFAHTYDEPGFDFNGEFESNIRVTSDRIINYFFSGCASDQCFDELVGTELVKSWLEGKRSAELYFVDRIKVAKGLEISHLMGFHSKSNSGTDARLQMKHIPVPKLGKDVIVGYGLRKYKLRRDLGLFFNDDDGWSSSTERVHFGPDGGIAFPDR